ncbi:MAG: hypothetical protein ACYC67_13105 [Prosthecobacter sp.]
MNSTAPTQTASYLIHSARQKCSSELTQWLVNAKDFRADYGEIHQLLGLPECEEDEPPVQLQRDIERALMNVLEMAPTRLQPGHFPQTGDWQGDLLNQLLNELKPLSSLESDSYGPNSD